MLILFRGPFGEPERPNKEDKWTLADVGLLIMVAMVLALFAAGAYFSVHKLLYQTFVQ
jgi:hypothetical protein